MRFDAVGKLVEHTLDGDSQSLSLPQVSVPPKPIPQSDWPLWAKALKQVAKPEDRGIGDVVARIIGDENSEAFKAWYKKTTGKNCGCKGRQARWNQMYPLRGP